jgi:hypothetical protein
MNFQEWRKRLPMSRGYAFLWRKIWTNSLLCEPGKKISRLEAWLYIANVLAAGKDEEKAGWRRGGALCSFALTGLEMELAPDNSAEVLQGTGSIGNGSPQY